MSSTDSIRMSSTDSISCVATDSTDYGGDFYRNGSSRHLLALTLTPQLFCWLCAITNTAAPHARLPLSQTCEPWSAWMGGWVN